MSKKTALYDGAKIYDTPKYTGVNKIIPGYNCSFSENYPTHSIGSNCEFTAFWERQLFRRLCSVLEFTIPKTWDRDFTLWVLFRNGFFTVLKNATVTDQNGKTLYNADIPQACTLSGRNIYYQPTNCVVANPLVKKQRWKIGTDCALIKLTPDYSGAYDIIHYRAENLAIMSQSLRMATLNSRFAHAYGSDSKAGAETLRTFLECIDKGQPAVAMLTDAFPADKNGDKMPWVEIQNDVGKNYIVDKLQLAIETEINAFLADIGIPVLSDKKERQINSEVNTTIGSAMTAIDVWIDCLKRSIDEAKTVFPDFGFDVRKPEYNGGAENANTENDG